MHGDTPGHDPTRDRELLSRAEERHGGVVDQHVHRPERVARGPDDPLAVLVPGQVGLHRDALAPRLADAGYGSLQGPGQRMLALALGPGAAHDRRALAREHAGDVRADATARAGDKRHLAGQGTHDPTQSRSGASSNYGGG